MTNEATLKLFIDEECTKEVSLNDITEYVTIFRNISAGDTSGFKMYLKNVGDRAAVGITFTKHGDTKKYLFIKTPGSEVLSREATRIPDIAAGTVVEILFITQIPITEPPQYYTVSCTLDYFTLPDHDTKFYNAYYTGESSSD